MPAPNLLNKLTVYGSMIENVCAVLLNHKTLKADALRSYILANPQDGALEAELIPYMLTVGLIDMLPAATASDFPTYRLASSYEAKWSTRLNLLHGLHHIGEVNSMILGLHAYLLSHDEYANRWLDYKDVYPVYNRDEIGQAGGDVAFNENKMRSWLRVVSYMGLIQPERSNSFVLAPRLSLVRELVRVVQAKLANGSGDWPLPEAVSLIESDFCQVTSNPGRLHLGFTNALLYLQEQAFLELHGFGDAEMVSFAGRQRYSHGRLLG